MPLRVYQQQTSLSPVALPRASSPALVDPTGAALADLARTGQEIAGNVYKAQLEADLHDRLGRMTAELTDLEVKLARDQDFRTSTTRFKDGADAIRDKYLEGVSHAGVKAALTKQYSQLALAKSLNVQKAAYGQEKDYNVASLDSNLEVYATSAANAKSGPERDLVLNQARLAITSMQQGGWITREEAGNRERKLLGQIDEATVLRDLQINPKLTSDKLSLDPAYAQNLDPVQRERMIDRGYRQAESDRKEREAAEEKARKQKGDELVKEAYKRRNLGTLTRDYIEEIKPFIEPSEYKSLIAQGADSDDPTAFSTLQGLLYSNPQEAERQAMIFHRNGRIRNETLSSVLSRARELGRQEGPRSAYERERLYITNALKPSEWSNDAAAAARFAIVMREFDDYALGDNRKPEELRSKADDLLKRFSLVNMIELARQTAAGAQANPQAQIEANIAEAARLMQQKDEGRISDGEFNRKMELLNKSTKAAEEAMRHGGTR